MPPHEIENRQISGTCAPIWKILMSFIWFVSVLMWKGVAFYSV